MIGHAKCTKLNSISRPAVIKYSDLVTSRVEESIKEARWIFYGYKIVQEVYKRNLCSNNIFFPHLTLDYNIFHIFIVSHPLLNVFVFLKNNIWIQYFTSLHTLRYVCIILNRKPLTYTTFFYPNKTETARVYHLLGHGIVIIQFSSIFSVDSTVWFNSISSSLACVCGF